MGNTCKSEQQGKGIEKNELYTNILTANFLEKDDDVVQMAGIGDNSYEFRTSFKLMKEKRITHQCQILLDDNIPEDQYIAIVQATKGQQKRVKLGRVQMKSGCIYEGEWKNAMGDGKGEDIMRDERFYEGDWVENKANGFGKLVQVVNKDKIFYEGQWFDDMANGKGVHIFVGNKYSQIENDLKHGQGEEVWPNGEKYIGSYEKGKKHGYGTFFHENGKETEGYWFHGKQHGQAIVNYQQKKKGIWYNGKRIRWLNADEQLKDDQFRFQLQQQNQFLSLKLQQFVFNPLLVKQSYLIGRGLHQSSIFDNLYLNLLKNDFINTLFILNKFIQIFVI